jgi:kinesin family protein 18/19
VLDGYNGTIFLYGQTKSGRHFEQGKTYTMLGCQDKLGILHYALTHIFTHKENRDNPKKLKVYISYLEIYNENLIDLLNPKSDPSLLKIKEDNRVRDRSLS